MESSSSLAATITTYAHGMFPLSSKKLAFRQILLMLHDDQLQRSKVLLKFLQAFLVMHCEKLICALVSPNPMDHITIPLQHSVAFPPSGAPPSHMVQLSATPNPDPNLSAGLAT
jgi:hypothetical protein